MSASLSYMDRKPPLPARVPRSERAKEMEVPGKKQEILNSGHQGGKAMQNATCIIMFIYLKTTPSRSF